MAADEPIDATKRFSGKIVLEGGKPIRFEKTIEESSLAIPEQEMERLLREVIKKWGRTSQELLAGRFFGLEQDAPLHMRAKCNVLVLQCLDGVFVRYDHAEPGLAKIRSGSVPMPLAEVAPQFSENVVHLSSDPSTYQPPSWGPSFKLTKVGASGGEIEEIFSVSPAIVGSTSLPSGFRVPEPPGRPPCLLSVVNEFDIFLEGDVMPAQPSATPHGPQNGLTQFTVHSRVRLPVGWLAIEVYPLLPAAHWKPEFAAGWAELDLLASIAQRNVQASRLQALDGRGATRKRFLELLKEFEALLDGPEEPVHQFLKSHPQLLSPTHLRYWSKLPFGNRVSDFVFQEPSNEYELVEIEAPVRGLFRKDGQQRQELTHAIHQTQDWVQYIRDNRVKVETELGLTGISANPRTIIIIGRSADLSEDNRKRLSLIQDRCSGLRILTYDDLIARARAILEPILGPLDLRVVNAEIYFH